MLTHRYFLRNHNNLLAYQKPRSYKLEWKIIIKIKHDHILRSLKPIFFGSKTLCPWKQSLKRKRKIGSLDWFYYRLPGNTTYRQVLMKQYWHHCPDLSWSNSIGSTDEQMCPSPIYHPGFHLSLLCFMKQTCMPMLSDKTLTLPNDWEMNHFYLYKQKYKTYSITDFRKKQYLGKEQYSWLCWKSKQA